MTSFDQFVAIDWSGARQVNTKAIAVAVCDKRGNANLLKPRGSILWSRQLVHDYLLSLTEGSNRVLVGIDCNLGLPAQIARSLLRGNLSGRRLWDALHALAPDTENFYAEPVWSSAELSPYFWQSGTMPRTWLNLRRNCEKVSIAMGLVQPESTLKLIGSKQVGKGGLAGMLMLHSLLGKTDKIAIWPFDEINKLRKAKLVICEIYPRLWLLRAGLRTKIRNKNDMCLTLQKLGAKGIPTNFSSDHDADALAAVVGLHMDSLKNYDLLMHAPEQTPLGRDIRLEGWIHSVPMLI